MTYDLNTGPPLFFVKRTKCEEYHCGHYSSVAPKLYLLKDAKSVCKQLNKEDAQCLEYSKEENPKSWWRDRAENIKKKGSWVVMGMAFTTFPLDNE